MKKVLFSLLFSAFFITIFACNLYADYSYVDQYHQETSPNIYQVLNQCNFFMYGDWYCLDTIVTPIATTIMVDNEDNYQLLPFNFDEFEYTSNTDIELLKPNHSSNTVIIKNEDISEFKVQYCDVYGNAIYEGYPRLELTYPDSSTKTYQLNKTSNENEYALTLDLPYGAYKYKYLATNGNYNGNLYTTQGNWFVTSRPYNFRNILPINSGEVLPDNIVFEWEISTNEPQDSLSYEIFLGKQADKPALEKFANSPANNSLKFTIDSLEHNKQYYWYMKIYNKYGAMYETDLFSFKTGGMVKKFYNAPNPFNPARGERTKFVFNMSQDGSAKITLYSEYGDKVWQSQEIQAKGNISSEIEFKGRDNSGKLLYNGTYVAILTKKYANVTETEKCRILIIK